MQNVSVIIPCRNEEGYIGKVLQNLLEQDFPASQLEILVIDGMSDDNTVQEIQSFSKQYPFIRCLENPRKIVPTALNIGIQEAKGEIIVRMDAHCEYPSNYISYLCDQLQTLEADNVGVAMIAHPRNESLKALTIAKAVSSKFGIGDSYHRTGIDRAIEMDSVPFGCYRSDVFDRIGLFDEELIRNQDDEFNARLLKHGGKIFLLPDIEIKYYARDTFQKISRMFYHYGYFKPLVNRKVGSAATMRQFVPPVFVLSNLIMVLMLLIAPVYGLGLWALIWFPYLMVNVAFSFSIAIKASKPALMFSLPITFIMIHFSYGWGYLKGLLKFQFLRSSQKIEDLSTNR